MFGRLLQVALTGLQPKPAVSGGVDLSHRLRWEADARIAVMHGSEYAAVDVPSGSFR
jgi:hypothetical protein